MKVALVYDRINKWGGAERVLLALKEIFPDAPLYTSVYNPVKTGWAKIFDIRTSFLQRFPYATSHHELLATLMPIAFESFSFDKYDVVISVTSESAKGIITKDKTLHICICLTPTRYLWSGYEGYFKNRLFRFLTKPVISYLRKWDVIAAQRPDVFVAISREVQSRIKKYYHRESTVIYPAVSLDTRNSVTYDKNNRSTPFSSNSDKSSLKNKEKEDYFLVVSRFVPYKKIEIAIDACNILQLPLKIIGTGVEEKKLKKRAGQTIEFMGNLTEEALIRYYIGCRALIFPGLEDLGLAVIEAQKFGKPVIAFKGGGTLETIVEGKTGEFFFPQTAEALVHTLEGFLQKEKKLSTEDRQKRRQACKKQAARFMQETFRGKLLQVIEKTLKNIK